MSAVATVAAVVWMQAAAPHSAIDEAFDDSGWSLVGRVGGGIGVVPMAMLSFGLGIERELSPRASLRLTVPFHLAAHAVFLPLPGSSSTSARDYGVVPEVQLAWKPREPFHWVFLFGGGVVQREGRVSRAVLGGIRDFAELNGQLVTGFGAEVAVFRGLALFFNPLVVRVDFARSPNRVSWLSLTTMVGVILRAPL